MRESAGQLPHGLHFLRMHQRGLGVLEIGDVDREHKTAGHAALGVALWHELAARINHAPVGMMHRVLIAHALSLQRVMHMARNVGIDLVADDRAHAAPQHVFLGQTKPVGIALIDVAVDFLTVKIGDQRRNRVGNQAQVLFTAPQRRGDALVDVVRLKQALIGGLQFRGPLGDPTLQLGMLLLDLLLIAATGRDVGVQGHKTVVRQGLTAHRQNLAAGTVALGVMRGNAARQAHALGHQRFHIAGTIFAALGIKAHEGLERRPHKRHLGRKVQQAQKSLVPRHDMQLAVNHGQALVQQIESRLKQLVPVMGLLCVAGGRGRHQVLAPALFSILGR